MLQFIETLKVEKDKSGRYKMIASFKGDKNQTIVLDATINQPTLHIDTSEQRVNDKGLFKHFVLSRSTSFHFNTEALCSADKPQLFTLNISSDKKEKTYTPKKHRKYNKKKNQF